MNSKPLEQDDIDLGRRIEAIAWEKLQTLQRAKTESDAAQADLSAFGRAMSLKYDAPLGPWTIEDWSTGFVPAEDSND